MILIHYADLRPRAWQQLWNGLAVFAIGVVLPYAVTCLWLWWAGVFDRFWFWTVTYSRKLCVGDFPGDGANCFWRQFVNRCDTELAIC